LTDENFGIKFLIVIIELIVEYSTVPDVKVNRTSYSFQELSLPQNLDGAKIFALSRQTLGPTHPPIQWAWVIPWGKFDLVLLHVLIWQLIDNKTCTDSGLTCGDLTLFT